jgi:lactate dehydrogenase-like 2-hydroxyacid dehydrogenase
VIRKKILVVARVPRIGLRELEDKFDIIYPDEFQFGLEDLKQHVKEADGIISVFILPLTGEVLKCATKLKIISNFGVGFNNIDLTTATSMGVVVCNTPNAVTEPTAEMAMGLMISVMRRITETDRRLRSDPNFKWGMMENLGSSLYGKTLGIIGMGRIGRALARRAVAAGMKIIYYNRTKLSPDIEAPFNAGWVPFEALISNADVISLHCPLSENTYHLIDDKEIKLMKDGVFIINTSRGSVVNENALVKYLQNGKIGGAGLDVFEEEPFIPAMLYKMNNVILTPHNATGSIDTRIELAKEASKNILDFFDGKKTISIVNPQVWD